MKGKFIILLVLIAVIGILIGKMWTEKEVGEDSHEPNEQVMENLDDLDHQLKESIQQAVNEMSIDEKIGQLIIGGFEGTTVTEDVKQLIQEWKIGGMILFANNLETPEQTVDLINRIQVENKNNKVPLFVSVDQEGGRVTRLPGLSNLPTNQQIGLSGNEENAYMYGQLIANQLRSFGFNMNFAPVLDIDSNPNNPVIGDRSFGKNPQIVSDFGVQMMKGMQDSSIISVVKHFPGHGDTHEDSHEELPMINKTVEDLAEFEWIPFEQAIMQNVDMVMTAHILLPKIDDVYPATLSPTMINDILRERLQYDGVVITDDMTMGAITTLYEIGDAAVFAIKAGVDIVLIAHGTDSIAEAISSIKEAVLSGEITEERINQSVARILTLKNKYELADKVEEIDVEKLNDEIRVYLDQLDMVE